VICRWIHRDSGILFDLLPVDHEVLGFSNRWYPFAVETAQQVELGDGLSVRMVTAVAFIATKLVAFADRGQGDVFASHDLEDVLNIVDGRESLERELGEAPPDLRDYVREAFAGLLAHRDFGNALPGHVTDPDRVAIIMQRLQRLAS
jgi:predicted nucleotidyltransferase